MCACVCYMCACVCVSTHSTHSLIVVVDVCLASDENFKNVQRNSKHRFLSFSSIYFPSLMTVVFSKLNLTVV